MNGKRKLYPLITLIFLLPFILNFGQIDIYKKIKKDINVMGEVYKQIMLNYVDPVDADKFVNAGIKGMLTTLDPYTVLISKDRSVNLDMMVKGKYEGVGIRLGVSDDSLTVISPMEGTPARRVGIISGDKIIKIDDKSTHNMSLEEAAKMIRGKRGTEVKLTIKREGVSSNLEFTVKREVIDIKNVAFSGFIEDDLGYIRFINFSRDSEEEIKEAITNLKRKNLKGLIIDLRNNPGGLLKSALAVADLFTPRGSILLKTRGRVKKMNKVYKSENDPLIPINIPVVVLVNEGSASASEIFAGIIQDLDRGVVVGSRTFGKGLVQNLINIDKKNILKISTAKYYIPSGRLIQKEDYYQSGVIKSDRDEKENVYTTLNGRSVMGGGGIFPDIEVKDPAFPKFITELSRQGMFFKFSVIYASNHYLIPPIEVDGDIINAFKDFLKSRDFKYEMDEEKPISVLKKFIKKHNLSSNYLVMLDSLSSDLQKIKISIENENIDMVKIILERELSLVSGGISSMVESSLDDDKTVITAVNLLRNPDEYNKILGIE